MKKPKIGLVGAGHIGGTLAHLALLKNMGHIALFDVAPGVAEGKALDLSQSAPLEGWTSAIKGSDRPDILADSDVLIVTAGYPRMPGMSRSDLLLRNATVIRTIGDMIRIQAPHAFVIVVTNPMDPMVWVMKEATGFAPEKVVGMGGVLDSARFASFLAEALALSPDQVHTLVLGGHGDLMVPLVRYTTVAGTPLLDWVKKGALSQERLDEIIVRTRQGGAEIISLLKDKSAYYTPATAALMMAESYLCDHKRLLPCAAWLTGQYGTTDIYAGVPARIGASGVETIWELDLTEQENKEFQTSVTEVKALIQQLKNIP